MCILLPAVDHVFADRLQLLINLCRLDAVGPEGVTQGVCHGTDHTILDEAVALPAVAVCRMRVAVH